MDKQQKELEKQQKEKLEGLERTQRALNLIIEMYRNRIDRDGIPHPRLTASTPSSFGHLEITSKQSFIILYIKLFWHLYSH